MLVYVVQLQWMIVQCIVSTVDVRTVYVSVC
jgi:hypothetical protein